MKQATHVQPSDVQFIRVEVCDLGGFNVCTQERHATGGHITPSLQASFSTADECADWVRSFLRNATNRKFGPK